MNENHGTQALWPQMIAALAAIDEALGLPADGCNSTHQTLDAIRELQAERDALRDGALAAEADGAPFTDTARAALLWVLWHHQGGSSPVGQPLRFALGMGAHDRLTDVEVACARRWGALHGLQPGECREGRNA